MSILVIGAAGFVGSHLVKRLGALGYRVCGMDIDNVRAKQVLASNIPFYCCDFGAQSSLQNVFKQENVEMVIQCAGKSIVENSVADPMPYYTNNALCNIFLLDTLLKSNITKMVYVSSATVFGEVEKMPITQQTIRNPISPLGNAQLLVENMLESFRISHGLTYAIVRASNITGMGEVENEYFIQNLGTGLIPNLLRYILGQMDAVNILGTSHDTIDLTAERDYIHVDDFCSACVNVIPKLSIRGEGMAYNIGSGKKYSVREVIAMVEQLFGVAIKTTEGPSRIGDPSRLYFDINKTRSELDWYPKYDSLELILKTMLPYYLAHRQNR
ncbi:MAG: NAD-dependent epimerase/dehydratase family protein [Puniceicoccales bacterium]|jgi:UDP-glucose 4-epimerase|nr:NAD-dependent epimerase/dehydratase family protein [Puniceicoccales bacterium]